MRFFSRINSHTVKDAKNRLKSVIKNDRINTSGDVTIDKMKKEITAVLAKYAGGDSKSIEVLVKNYSSSHCCFEATVSIRTA